ncbi:MAG: asparagine synthase (glutamine-hydrolyzing) [Bacilli bacterium]|nr:asparagine synthase (glutamine-hydrolyzing) [Bacilli bacterium]
MCGFVGFCDKKEKKEKDKLIKKMAERIIHRGPDSDGYYTDNNIALGFRRLSIIDLSGGDQPIFNEKHDKVIVFNGEVYNYRELRQDLLERGHKFSTTSDTEVVLHGYEEYGEDLFNMLRGMYAFVIYDIKKNELVGVRDIFGIKPFYYYKDNKEFMFGSEIKSFLDHPGFIKELNKEALEPYLCFQSSVLNETFFKNVFKLKPGHFLKYNKDGLKITEYHSLDYRKESGSFKDYQEKVRRTLEDSIKYHQISDVEVGSYLSGGVDSSYVVSKFLPDKTFTVGFDYNGFNETTYAKDLSDMLKINNYAKLVTADEFFKTLPVVVYHADEPHDNLTMVPLYYLSKLAREQVKVVLSGEGSDEMFGGYNEYNVPKMEKLYLHLPLFLRKFNASIARKLPKFPGKNTIIKDSNNIENRYFSRVNIMDTNEANSLLTKEYQSNLTPAKIVKPYYDKVKGQPEVLKKMYIDTHFWLPNDILLKADKMSMANSIELRVPFLDREVWNLSKVLPTKYMVRKGQTKYIFRSIAHESLPEEWAKRRKLGFPVPFNTWLKDDKYYKKVKEQFNKDYVSEFFNLDKINKMLDDHHNDIKPNTRKIFTIYCFLLWYERYFILEK